MALPVDNTQVSVNVVEIGARLGWLMRGIQVGSWVLFFAAWLQIGRGDWLHHKIRNSYIIYWGRFLLFGYGLLAANTALGKLHIVGDFLVWGFYADLGTHLAFSFLAAVALWLLRVWPAGDAKLFILLAGCYPLMSLPVSFHQGLRFFETLINIFVPAMLVLFVLSLDYIYRTRLQSQKVFLQALGLRRELSYFADQSRELGTAALTWAVTVWVNAKNTAKRAWASLRARGLRAVLDLLRDPGERIVDLFDWILSVTLMSVITYYVGDVIQSMFLKSLFMFALFFLWNRIQQHFGQRRTVLVAGVAVAAGFGFADDTKWESFLEAMANITVFSLAVRLGMQWTTRIVAGKLVYVFLSIGSIAALPMIEHLLEPVVNFLLMPALQFLVGLVPWQAVAEAGLFAKAARALDAWSESTIEVSMNAGSNFIEWASQGTVLSWALMGAFFGLALVFARIWDKESYESVAAADVKAGFMPGPALLEALAEDEEFFEEHFDDLYADGLTEEQAAVLREWCEENQVAAVPLAPTMSFASWVFAGYLLTVLFDGHLMSFVYG